MESILIKDTTREERERIVAESIGNVNGSCDGYNINGVMTISIIYGDMDTPYSADMTFTAQKK